MHPIHPSLTYPIHPPFFHPFQSNNIYCDSIGSKNFEWTSRTGASRYTPSQHILSTHYINTLLQHTNTPYQHTIPTHPMRRLAGPLTHNSVRLEDPNGYLDVDGVSPVVTCGLKLRVDSLSEYDSSRMLELNAIMLCYRCVRYGCPDHFNFQVIPQMATAPAALAPFTVANCKGDTPY